MGNHHSQTDSREHGREGAPRKSISRTSSGADIKEQNSAPLIPIDKLAKILAQRTAEEESGQTGISSSVFARHLFAQYPDVGTRVFAYMARCANGSSAAKTISTSAFRHQAEKFLAVITDEGVAELYVKMFAEGADTVTRPQLTDLLMSTYRLAMDHYPDGPQTCLHIHHTLQAVVDSAFHKKMAVSIGYMSNWLLHHLPRLVPLLHRYVVHVLTTAYRALQDRQPVASTPSGIELSTPVLEKNIDLSSKSPPLLPVSQVWLLATSLPPLYTMPSEHRNGSPSSTQPHGMSTQSLIAKMLGSTFPSHWALLYNSNQHGMGANRFRHHVLSYRGPTLTFLRGEEGVEFCLATDSEWLESNHYWGHENCCILQILPLFHVIERGAKLMYMNMRIRGYHKGIRAGSNSKEPSIEVNESFSRVMHSGIPYPLLSIEVWGCGTTQLRDQQIELKKWQVKEAEKQRVVKLSAADWADHPDRYLLELGGRQNYNAPSS